MKNVKLMLLFALFAIIAVNGVTIADEKPEMADKLSKIRQKLNNPQKADANESAVKAEKAENPAGYAKIEFETSIKDLGEVGPSTNHEFVYKFKNTGTEVLKITKTHAPCSCTIPNLKKKEYKPGEEGEINVKFDAPKTASKISKYLYIYSNDANTPKYELKIQGNVVLKVAADPEFMTLNLGKENAGAAPITLTSKDGKKFAVTSVTVAKNVAKFDIDKDKKAKSITITPEFDLEKLKDNLNGVFTINLTHPDCKNVIVRYSTPPAFVVEPRAIIQTRAEPGKPYKRTLWITSNYSDNLEIESISSQKNTVNVLSKEAFGNRYKIEVELTGPAENNSKRRFHSDTLIIKPKGGEEIKVRCQQWYPKEK